MSSCRRSCGEKEAVAVVAGCNNGYFPLQLPVARFRRNYMAINVVSLAMHAPTFETNVDCIPLRSQKWNCLLDVLVTVAAVHVVVVTTLRCSRRYPHIPLLVLAPMCLHCVFDLEVLVEEARFEHVDDLIRTAL